MAYIGKQPTIGNFQKCDAISVVNGQAAYTLQVGGSNVSPESANHCLVSLNGILQAPTDSYTISGSTLTFASNLVTGDVIDFVMILGNVLDLGVPSDNTVSTAKIVDGAVTAAKLASGVGGKVLQVVSVAKTDTFNGTSSSYTDITGYNVSITPTSTSNKVLIQGFITVSLNDWNANGIWLQIVRDSTNILTSSGGTANGSFAYGGEAASEFATKKFISPLAFSFLDSPSTTSATTYKVQIKVVGTSGEYAVNYQLQGGTGYTGTSTITAMEIAG